MPDYALAVTAEQFSACVRSGSSAVRLRIAASLVRSNPVCAQELGSRLESADEVRVCESV